MHFMGFFRIPVFFCIVILVCSPLNAENLNVRFVESVRNCDIQTAEKLLDGGADVNCRMDWSGETPLMIVSACSRILNDPKDAAERRTFELVRFLIAKGARVNDSDRSGRTVLMHNLRNGRAVVKLLLDAGADPRARDAQGLTVFHNWSNDADTVKLLIRAGGDINARDNRGLAPLVSAMYDMSLNYRDALPAWVERMVSLGADVNVADLEGATPLMYAASLHYGDIVELLLKKGARVKVATRTDRNTALHYAAHEADELSVRSLLKAGADPNAENAGGVTPYMMAEFGGSARWRGTDLLKAAGGKLPPEGKKTGPFRMVVVQRIFSLPEDAYADYGDYRLQMAVRTSDTRLAMTLLKKGVRGKPSTMTDLLSLAAYKDNAALIDACIAAGVRIDLVNDHMMTPLAYGVAANSVAAVRRLLESGADPCVAGCLRHCIDAMAGDDRLVRKGTGLDAAKFVVDWSGYDRGFLEANRSLAEAVSRKDIDAAKKSLDRGADPDLPARGIRRDAIRYPLTHAIEVGDVNMARLLVERGADVNVNIDRDSRRSPLAVALTTRFDHYYPAERLSLAEIEARRVEIADLLVHAGADVNGKTRHVSLMGGSFREMAYLPHLAAEDNIEAVRYLLSRGADVNAFGGGDWQKDGATALMRACGTGNHEMIRELMAAGADTGKKNGSGKTALHFLAGYIPWHGQGAFAGGINAKANADWSHATAVKKYEETVMLLVKSGADMNVADAEGNTPLMIAARANNSIAVQCFLAAGADPLRRDAAGWSALTHAAVAADAALVERLMKAGAGTAAGKDGMTPLGIALAWGNAKAASMLRGTDTGSVESVEGQRIVSSILKKESISQLLSRGNRKIVNFRDRNGLTPLMHAIVEGDESAAMDLIAAGADVSARAPNGSTPLLIFATDPHIQYHNRTTPLLNALLRAGADIEAHDREGRTPLMAAVQFENQALMKALFAAGARKDVKNRAGMGILMYSLSNPYQSAFMVVERERLFDYYLNLGLDVNAATGSGVTALMLASWMGDYAATRKLLVSGADPAKKTDRGTTAADMALVRGHSDIASLLLRGIRPSARQRLALARLYAHEGRFKPAEREIEKALSEKKSAIAYNELVLLHMRARDPLFAIEAARKGLALWPDDATLLYNGACAWALRGDTGEACRWLDRAVDAGFRDRKKLLRDPDLRSIRESGAFQGVLEKIGPGK